MFGTSDERQRHYWEQDHGFRRYTHPVVRLFAEQRLAYVSSWLNLSDIRNALDVGCGDGFSTFYMRDHVQQIWGVDRSPRMLAGHPLKPLGKLVMSDIQALPFQNGWFDLVYGWEVLHHVSDPGQAIAEMARVSRRYVLIAEPNRNNPLQFVYALIDREERWVLRHTLQYLSQCVEHAGLRVVHASSGGYILPNATPPWIAPLLSRLPYRSPIGISNWILGVKPAKPTEL